MAGSVQVHDVSKRFRIYHERNQSVKSAIMRRGRAKYEEFWALQDVSFDIPAGGTFGLVGHNGSGKSTLLKCMARILVPDKGSVTTQGRVSALLELGAGFHPELSGRDNVYLNGSILGLTKRDIDARFDEIVDFAGLERFIDTPVKNYSSGMFVRLGFSVAINVEPDILLVDEVLAVGDQAFQQRSAAKFQEFKDSGRTIVIVSHALGQVRELCDNVAWLDHGRVLETGETAEIVARYAEIAGVEDESGAAWSRELELSGVDFGAGRNETELTSLDALEIRVGVDVHEAIDDAFLELRLRQWGGGVVAMTSTSLDRDRLSDDPSITLTRWIDSLPLGEDTYVVDATIRRTGTKRVVHEAPDLGKVYVRRKDEAAAATVVLPGEWR